VDREGADEVSAAGIIQAHGVRCVALLCVASAAPAAEPAPAVQVFEEFQQRLQAEEARADWTAYLADAQRLKGFLNESPASGLEVARAQMQLGQRAPALAEVKRFLDMGQTNDLLDSPLFRTIRTAVAPRIAGNGAPISLAQRQLEFTDPGLVPEDIDYDSQTQRFFVTSVLEHKIVSLDQKGNLASFAEAPEHWPMLALKVDAQRRRLWATEVALDGFQSVARSDWGRSVLLEYELDKRTLLARYGGPPHSNLGDMVLAMNGEPIVSDGTGGGVYRLQDHKLRRIDHGEFISPQTLAICEDDHRAFVPDYVRGLAQLNLDTGAVHWLPMRDRFALDGIDGLYCHHGVLTATQNGATPERVVNFILRGSLSAVQAEQVIERTTPVLDPTHGVYVGDTFYYIANSGWNVLDEHGAVKPGTHLTRARLMKIGVSSVANTMQQRDR
jgi:hypothetical protein